KNYSNYRIRIQHALSYNIQILSLWNIGLPVQKQFDIPRKETIIDIDVYSTISIFEINIKIQRCNINDSPFLSLFTRLMTNIILVDERSYKAIDDHTTLIINRLIKTTNAINILEVDQVDGYLSSLNVSLNITSNSSIIMTKSSYQLNDVIILVASFTRDTDGKVIDTQNFNELISSKPSAAAIVGNKSLSDVQSLNMMIQLIRNSFHQLL
ncbi:unnamed protein product, partial [Adineta steineri]